MIKNKIKPLGVLQIFRMLIETKQMTKAIILQIINNIHKMLLENESE
jgi:hypothetical protein